MQIGPISVPGPLLSPPPPGNERRIRGLRESVLSREGVMVRSPAPGYLMWLLDPVPALGPETVVRWVRTRPAFLVAQTSAFVLLFGDTAEHAEGLMPLRDALPGSAAAQRGEPYELMPTFTAPDTGELIHAVVFQPPDWAWTA